MPPLKPALIDPVPGRQSSGQKQVPGRKKVHSVNAENYYIVATAQNDPSLQVKISGPYLTCQAARADLEAAIDEAMDIDPCAKSYDYSISRLESRKPGVIQHMASHS